MAWLCSPMRRARVAGPRRRGPQQRPEARLLDGLERVQMPGLRMLHHVPAFPDTGVQHLVPPEQRLQLRQRLGCDLSGQLGMQQRLVLQAQRVAGKARVGFPVLQAEGLANPQELLVVQGQYGQLAVRGVEYPVGCADGLPGGLRAGQFLGKDRGLQRAADVEQADLHVAALRGTGPVQQRRGACLRRVHAGGYVGQQQAYALRRSAGIPVGVHQARVRLHDGIGGWMVRERPVRPVAADGHVHGPEAARPQAFVVQAQALHDLGAEVLHDDVGPFRQPQDHRPAFRAPGVDGQALLAAVVGAGNGAVPVAGDADVAPPVALGRLDLDHHRALASQKLRAVRACHTLAQIQHGESLQRHEPLDRRRIHSSSPSPAW